jgi:hypothetical protein
MHEYAPPRLTEAEIETRELREQWRQAILAEREAKLQAEISRRIARSVTMAPKPKLSRNKAKAARKARRAGRK